MTAPAARLELLGTVRRLWPFLEGERRRLAALVVLALFLAVVDVSGPWLIGRIVDSARRDISAAPARAGAAAHADDVLLLLALAIARGLLTTFQRAEAGRTGEEVASRLRVTLWRHLQDLPLEEVRARGPGRLLVRFVGDARAIQRAVTEGVVRLGQDVCLCAAVLLALTGLNWRLGVAAALVVVAQALLFWRVNPDLREASRTTRNRRVRLVGYLHERIDGLVAIKASVRQETETSRVEALSRDVARRGTALARARAGLEGRAVAIVGAGAALVLALALGEARAGRLTRGALVSAYVLLGLLLPALRRIAAANRSLQEAHISVHRLSETLGRPVESGATSGLPALSVPDGRLRFEEVSLASSRGGPTLDRVSLRAERGELVAVTGATGAGTSAILELLVGLRRPSAGRILVDGQDLAEVSLHSLRSAVGYVGWDAVLFDGTIAENVAYGVHADTPGGRVRRAAEAAGLDRLVAALPRGWRTHVGTGGRRLPLAQRRTVALARALAGDPRIVLLDAIDSSLDASAARDLARRLRRLAVDRTLVVATRGRPLLERCDRIYVLDRGRVIETGTFAELARSDGLLARLHGPARGLRRLPSTA